VKTGQNTKTQPVLISFSGMDGSGKSTQILYLQDALQAAGIPIKNLAFWDHVAAFPGARANFSHKFLKSDGKVGTPERPAQRNDKNARAWYLTVARLFLYSVDAFKLRAVVKQAQANFDGVIIFDRYIYDQLATMSLDNALARAYARLILQIVPRPDVSYVLDAIPEEARRRKPEYPLDFLHKYRHSYLQLQKLAHLDLIGAMPLEDVRTAILKKLERCIKLEAAQPHYSLESV
jgi:thymidylate kinase